MFESITISTLMICLLLAAVSVGVHLVVDCWIRRSAIRRLHAIQDEMGKLCKNGSCEQTNEKVEVLAHEAARHLARFDIDYWAVVNQRR